MPKNKEGKAKKKKSSRDEYGSNDVSNSYRLKHGYGMPDRAEVEIRYAEKGTITGTATASAQQFNMNSIQKPNRTSTGHQPRYDDLFAQVYTTYIVTKCKWWLILSNANGTTTRWATLMSRFSSTIDINDMIENEYSSHGVLSINSGGAAVNHTKGKMFMSKLLGGKYDEADSNAYAQIGNSPTDTAILTIDAEPMDGNATIAVGWDIVMVFSVVFMGRKDVGPSLVPDPLKAPVLIPSPAKRLGKAERQDIQRTAEDEAVVRHYNASKIAGWVNVDKVGMGTFGYADWFSAVSTFVGLYVQNKPISTVFFAHVLSMMDETKTGEFYTLCEPCLDTSSSSSARRQERNTESIATQNAFGVDLGRPKIPSIIVTDYN
jgi:hypothetical protein